MRVGEIIREDATTQTRQQIIDFAANDEHSSVIWTEIKPDLSGASNTFWVSMSISYPFILVDPVVGDHFLPSRRCHAFKYGEATGYAEIDRWVQRYGRLLKKLLHGKVDQHQFYVMLEKTSRINEMANVPGSLSGLPVYVWCSPQMHSADCRIKVSTSASNVSIENLETSVAVRTNRVDGTPLAPRLLELVRKWIVLNHDTIMALWDGTIQDNRVFLSQIKSVKGHENDPVLDWDAYLARLSKPVTPTPIPTAPSPSRKKPKRRKPR